MTFLITAHTLLAGLNLQICHDIDDADIGLMPAPCGCGRLNAIAGDREILRIVDNFLTFLIMARALLAGLNLQICYDIDNAGIGLIRARMECGRRLRVMR